MDDKPKNTFQVVIVLLMVTSIILSIYVLVRYHFEPPSRPSAVKGLPTTQPVPFDAETREQVRDFVADENDRQTGRSFQQFNTLASILITVAATLLVVAMAVFGLSWWRQVQEHRVIIKEADEYRKTIKGIAEKVEGYDKHSKKNLEQMEERSKNYLEQMKEDQEQIKKTLTVTQSIRKSTMEASRSSKANKHFTQALTYQNEGELKKAIEEYGRSIATEESPEAYYNRGNIWAEKEEFDKAIADYNKAIELDPKKTKAFNNRGAAWAKKEEFDKAIADFDKAIKLDPKEPAAFNNRGAAWAEKEEFDKAIADYDKAIELDPKNIKAFNNRGIVWAKKEEFDKAIADYDKAIELTSKKASSYLNVAEVLITSKRNFRQAVERLREGQERSAIASDRDRLIAFCLEGIALALNGDDASAAEAEANRLLDGGVKASEWDSEPMERFMQRLNQEGFAPAALETARRIQDKLKGAC